MMYLKVLSFFCIVVLCSCGADNHNTGSALKLGTGEESVTQTDSVVSSRSIDQIESDIDAFGESVSLLLERAKYWSTTGNLLLVSRDLKKAFVLDSTDQEVLLRMGKHHLLVGQSRDSKDRFEQCSKLHKENIPCREHLMEMYFAVEDYDASARYVQEILTINPEYAKAHFYSGMMLLQKDTASALLRLHKANELDPNSLVILDKLAQVYASKNDPRSLDFYALLQRKFPEKAKPYFDLGNVYLRLSSWSKAVAQFQAVIQRDSQYTGAEYNLAFALYKEGNVEQAIEVLSIYINRDNSDVEALFARGFYFETIGNIAQAVLDFKKCLLLRPGYPPAVKRLENIKQ